MSYSRAVKVSILKRALPPNEESIKDLSNEMGISRQTIHHWIKEASSGTMFLVSSEKSPRSFTAKDKYRLLMESAKVPSEELGRFLRERGIHSEHLTLWNQELTEMMSKKENENAKELKQLKQRVKELEKELTRKEKALAEAAALLILKKKLNVLIEGSEDD